VVNITSPIYSSLEKVELTVAAKQVLELFHAHGITATSKESYEHLWNHHSFAFTNQAFVDFANQKEQDYMNRVVEEKYVLPEEKVTSDTVIDGCTNIPITIYLI